MDKSLAPLVSSSPKHMYKTLHQMITSSFMPKTAILATSHKLQSCYSTTVAGEEKSVIKKCQRSILCLALKTSSPTGRVANYSYINASVQAQ